MELLVASLQWLKLFLIVLAVSISIRILYIIFSFRSELPFVPTSKKTAQAMVRAAKITSTDHVIDLGAGSGAILSALMSQYPQVQTVGVEYSIILSAILRLKKLFHFRSWEKVTIVRQDFFNMVLTHYSVIFGYLTPIVLKRLQPVFNKLKSGARVVLYQFPMDNPAQFKEKKSAGGEKYYICIYKTLNNTNIF